MTKMTENEEEYFVRIKRKMDGINSLMKETSLPMKGDALAWFIFLNEFKNIQGNLGNLLSFTSTMLAKRYLTERFEIYSFDAALKPQGAPGIDIDIQDIQNRRIVCEIKNTVPYQKNFGSSQRVNIKKDLEKLRNVSAKFKLMMVTNEESFQYLSSDYYGDLAKGIEIINLINGNAFIHSEKD